MFVINQHLRIGKHTFSRSNAIEIKKSTNLITDTATLKLPISAVITNNNSPAAVETAQLIQVGDPVEIFLGYNQEKLNSSPGYNEFNGVVKSIKPGIPLVVECEDYTWYLKQKALNKSWSKTTLSQVLQEIVDGTKVELADGVPDITLEPLYLKDKNGLTALQQLKDDLGLTAYMNAANKLYVGLAYTDHTGNVNYQLNGDESNVINTDNLKWRTRDERLLKVKAIGVAKDNSRIEEEVGDSNGPTRTLYFYNLMDRTQLKERAGLEMDKLRYDGYEGSIKTFLLPNVQPGMTAVLGDERFKERAGNYYVESVTTSVGSNGARRKVELGIRL